MSQLPAIEPPGAAAHAADAAAVTGAAPAACPNCFQPLPAPAPPFCPQCGQETRVRAPRLGEFLQQFGGAYLSTEGALWRTLRLLLTRPGELTAQYLAGRRKHYVLPLRLYLTVSLLVLLALRLVAHVQIESPDAVQVSPTELRNGRIDIGLGRAGLRDGVFYCENLPGWVCRRLQARMDVKGEALVGMLKGFGERFVANLGSALFLLLPGFALGMQLVHWNRRLHFTEHLVFALHVHAFWFLMLGLTLVPTDWVKLPALLAVPVYTLLAMRRVYGGRWWPRLLRAGLVACLYLLLLTLALVGVALWSAVA